VGIDPVPTRNDSATRERRSIVLVALAAAWLFAAAQWVPWTLQIVTAARHGREFTVDWWTLLNPFLTVGLVPLSVVFLWRGNQAVAALLLTIPAASWLLYEILVQELFLFDEPVPRIVAVFVLSVTTVLVVGAYAVRRILRA
jgi:hypothetical protein